MNKVIEILKFEFEKINAKFKTVSIIHLKELQDEINEWKQKKLITKKFFNQNYGEFIFTPPKNIPDVQSIIIIGIPQKITSVHFSYKGKEYQTVIPPTYIYSGIRSICNEILSRILEKKGYLVDRAILPLKLLAVRSGLGQYGKNNICYVDGMGSFTRLEAFYTNYEFPNDDWYEKRIMKACKTCYLCKNACPTHCIPKKRFLIHADHCLTHFNENVQDFPNWVSNKSHNAIVGCMRCQIVCPMDKKFLQTNEQIINFSEEEISIILQKIPYKNILPTLAKKLENLNLKEYYSLLGRNLKVIMNI